MIYDNNNARLLLGCLMLNSQLLNSDKYILTKADFEPVEFHLRLYQAISALAKHGAKLCDAIDIYGTAEKYTTITTLFDANNLKDFCITIKQLANIDNVDYYYEEVRKNTILREYAKNGFDVSKFSENVGNVTLKEIVDFYDGVQIKIKKDFYKDKNIVELKAGDGFEDIKEMFKQEPMFGATTFSEYVNTATRGWVNGQLSIYSCPSGCGKSTIGIYNLVKVCCPEIWDYDKKAIIENPCYQHKGGLYLQYEMNERYEVTPKIVASISGVPTYHILNGYYEDDEEERVNRAIEILHESNLYIVTMPSFTVGLIENYIRDYVINHNVGYVVFDYISEAASASSDIAKQNGVQTRSDQVLAAIASKLKDIAVEYNVAIMSFTQVNANINNQEVMDAGVIAGSRAVQNKCDVAAVIAPLRAKEKEICKMMMESHFPDSIIQPNRVVHLYKMRFSSEDIGIKIYFYLNLNNGHVKDFFVTDRWDNLYTMDKTKLIYR